MDLLDIDKLPRVAPPRTELAYLAVVDISEGVALGRGPLGERRIVPIVGGRFEGPGLRGSVLPGGADRQLIRPDGVRLLDALYEMQTEDGAVLTVRNRALVRDSAPGEVPAYAFSTLEVTAPEGPHAWLNRHVLVGTLRTLRPAQQSVMISVYKVL